jgi:hypothetical protein
LASGTGNRDEWGKMGKKTGRPRGRPSGARNHHTLEREQRISEAASVIEELLPSAFKGDAHALLMAVYKDQTQPLSIRLDAAKAAIAYEKPRLAAVEHSGDADKPVMFTIVTGVPRGDDETLETGGNDGISSTAH